MHVEFHWNKSYLIPVITNVLRLILFNNSRFSEYMKHKNKVMPLNMVFKNESKYEDCFEILDTYETATQSLYIKAFGKLKGFLLFLHYGSQYNNQCNDYGIFYRYFFFMNNW